MAKEKFKSANEEEMYRKLCADINAAAQEIVDSGHVVVFTSPKDKEPLYFANAILHEVTDDRGPKPAATAGARRFTAI